MQKTTNRLSVYALVTAIMFMAYMSFFFYPKWQQSKTEATISWDVSGYYFYLPAFFIYQDYKDLVWKDSILKNYVPTPQLQQAFKHPSGNYVMKYPLGQSILMSPFFALGHVVANQSSLHTADGFSLPYQRSLGIGMLVYSLLGLLFFRKLFLLWFNDQTTALCILLLVFGTNYLNYASIEQAQSHNTLFFLYGLLIWLTSRYYTTPSTSRAISIGATVGLMTLIRPTELLGVCIPVFWSIENWQDVRERIFYFLQYYKHTLLFGLSLLLLVSLQLIYWKMASGHWIVYSYEEQGFSWKHPHVWDYMFSPRSGWLRHTPMMMLFFIGLPIVFFYKKQRFLIIIFSTLFTYVVCAWDIWWFGGRAMIQSYPILFFSIASLFHFIKKRNWLLQSSLFIFVGICIYLNLWWTYHAHTGNIQVTENTDTYWQKTVGRWSVPQNTIMLNDNEEQAMAQPTVLGLLFRENLYSLAVRTDSDSKRNPFIALQKNSDAAYTKSISPVQSPNAKNILFVASISLTKKEWDTWSMPEMQIIFLDNHNHILKQNIIRLGRIANDYDRKDFYINASIPNKLYHEIQIRVINEKSEKPIYLHSYSVYYY